MIVGDDVERLDEDICSRYPYPLVATYDRALFQAPDPAEAHEYLLDLFEVTLKYCTTIALAQYFHDHGGDAKLNRDLAEIERPSLGHWNGWLRDILALYRHAGRALAIPELDAFYRVRHDGAVLAAAQSLWQLMTAMGYRAPAADATGISTQQFFDLLVGYRNRLAHGARPSPHDRAAVAALLAPALRQLYQQMSPLAEYRLVYVRSVTLEFEPDGPHRYRHVVTYLTGQTPRGAANPFLLAEPYPDKQLYLLDKTSEFRPLLSLHPFLIFAHCVSCNREQTFVLNMTDANSQDYLGYQCTHHFSPTEYLDYMHRLLGELGITVAAAAPLLMQAPVETNGASALAPPPPPPPPASNGWAPPPVPAAAVDAQLLPERKRRTPWVWAGAGGLALVAAIILVVALTHAAPAPPPQPTPTLTPAPTQDLSALRQQYEVASGRRNAATAQWVAQVDALIAENANTAANQAGYDETYANAIQAFDNALLTMPFPSSMSGDVHALDTADAALIGDLRSAGQGISPGQFSGDKARAQSAINNLQNDIGIPPNTPYVQPT